MPGQNFVAETMIFSKILECTRSDFPLQRFARIVAKPVHDEAEAEAEAGFVDKRSGYEINSRRIREL